MRSIPLKTGPPLEQIQYGLYGDLILIREKSDILTLGTIPEEVAGGILSPFQNPISSRTWSLGERGIHFRYCQDVYGIEFDVLEEKDSYENPDKPRNTESKATKTTPTTLKF